MPAKVVCVVGPTASGKTKMGVELAKRFGGEVVSVDSMQIYRGMTIGTAAPTMEEMDGVPHHMIAVADPSENWSVARFTEEADRCIADILSRGKLPVLVGGTGLYLDALVKGNSFAQGSAGTAVRQALQKRMTEEGAAVLLEELRAIDPVTAERLHVKDEKRIVRALEIWQETGQTMTEHDLATQKLPPKYEAIYIGLNFNDRADLRERIDHRVDIMVQQGLLQEVRQLLSAGIPRTATSLQAIGYKQFLAVEEGRASVEEAVEEVKLRSRQYAKRQLTWLRRNQAIHWIGWEKVPDFQSALQIATEILTAQGLG